MASGQSIGRIAGGELLAFLLAALPTCLLFAFIGFVVSVVLLMIVQRRGWIRRTPAWWSVLVKLTYVYVPLLLIASGAAFGVVVAAQVRMTAIVEERLSPLAHAQLPAVRQWLTQKVDWSGVPAQMSLEDAAQRVQAALYVQPHSDGLWDRTSARAVNYVTWKAGKWIITAGLREIMSYAARKSGDSLGLDKETVTFSVGVIRRMDLSQVDEDFFQILKRALLGQLNAVAHGLMAEVGLFALMGLSLPTLEMAVYYCWLERRRRTPRVAAAAPVR